MTCDTCGAELVAQTVPARLRWHGPEAGFVPEGERVVWVHRRGTTCGGGEQ